MRQVSDILHRWKDKLRSALIKDIASSWQAHAQSNKQNFSEL
jgi:hypothetical protein